MKRLIAALIVLSFAAPSLAGLKLTATPDKPLYLNGDTINFTLRIEATSSGSPSAPFNVSGLTGPIGGFNGFNFSMVPQAATGPTPAGPGTVTGTPPWTVFPVGTGLTFVNFTVGGSPLNAAGDSVVVGNVPFTVNDASSLGLFDLIISDFAIGTNQGNFGFAGGAIGTAVVGIPEPSSFLFLGLAGSGIAGIQVWRRRRSDENSEEATEEAMN